DRVTGQLLWSVDFDQDPHPAFNLFWDFDRAGTNLIVVGTHRTIEGTSNLVLRDYRASDGRLKWETIEPNLFAGQVEIANGLVYVGTGNVLAAYRLADGTALWKITGASFFTSAFAASEDALISSVLTSAGTTIERRDPFTGALVWQAPLPST